MDDVRFQLTRYTIRRKVLKVFGAAFHVFGPDGRAVFFSNMKAFKLREDIRLYESEEMREELLAINARQIVDFAAAYDVVDARNGEKVGALKRRGMRSLVRDHWILMDRHDAEIGELYEESAGLAILRRLLGELASVVAPQRYQVDVGGRTVARGRQNRNPFVYKVTLDLSEDVEGLLDRRLGLAAGVLLAAIEGKQG